MKFRFKLCSYIKRLLTISYKSENSFAFWVILHEFLSSVDIFQHYTFSNYSVTNKIIIVSNGLDSDLGPNCLQRSSVDDKIRC